MKKLLTMLICIAMLVSIAACGSSAEKPKEETITAEASTQKAEAEEPAEMVPKYAEDEVVNAFIIAFNEVSEEDFASIKKGNIRTKYHAGCSGYWFELLNSNATNKISISIYETNDTADAGVAGMRQIVRDCIVAIDNNTSDDDIYSTFDALVEEGYLAEDVEIGSVIITFVPDKELSSGHSKGHIVIDAQ